VTHRGLVERLSPVIFKRLGGDADIKELKYQTAHESSSVSSPDQKPQVNSFSVTKIQLGKHTHTHTLIMHCLINPFLFYPPPHSIANSLVLSLPSTPLLWCLLRVTGAPSHWWGQLTSSSAHMPFSRCVSCVQHCVCVCVRACVCVCVC